ncbi:MAG TPA: hypothetical protein PKL46_15695 [Aquabacterium sp.]|nr:hypothetical protein [Aquabacterium sp.]
MADSKEGESFFRKVVRFVANPATEWSEVATRQDEGNELEKSELKAMVERKRRNDFVRKRELDTLRKLRREGLSPEQLAALGGSSKVDDSEARLSENSIPRADSGVKAKIDEIEQQMVGEQVPRDMLMRQRPPARRPTASPQHPSDFYNAATEPVAFGASRPPPAHPAQPGLPALDQLPPLPGLGEHAPEPARGGARAPAPAVVSTWAPQRGGERGAAPTAPPPVTLPRSDSAFGPSSSLAIEVNEVVHDPELDEAVIAFANADFNQCEQALVQLCRPAGPRAGHAETWLVLFDLYRGTGQQQKFEQLALEFTTRFDRSAPQWYSLPRRVADATAEERPDTRGVKGDIGWVSPPVLDIDAVARLRSATLQLPLPWVLDWTALEAVEAEAAAHLNLLFRQWAPQPIDMRWIAAERLLHALQDAAPTGVRDADPSFWMARLEALRLSNRPDQFDETAIDYCVTYEVSPPSWERARCQVRASQGGASTTPPPMSIVSEVHSTFMESGLVDDGHAARQVATVDLSGQLAGDIGAILDSLDRKLGAATLVHVSCARLIRVDFIAAGDLLNWVLAKQGEQRSVTFIDAHRLVALFFGAMGINEHARVQVPRN